jgi:hypothetical protein
MSNVPQHRNEDEPTRRPSNSERIRRHRERYQQQRQQHIDPTRGIGGPSMGSQPPGILVPLQVQRYQGHRAAQTDSPIPNETFRRHLVSRFLDLGPSGTQPLGPVTQTNVPSLRSHDREVRQSLRRERQRTRLRGIPSLALAFVALVMGARRQPSPWPESGGRAINSPRHHATSRMARTRGLKTLHDANKGTGNV